MSVSWFKFFPKSWAAKTSCLSAEEKGALITLMSWAAGNNKSLPDSSERLGILMGTSAKKAKRIVSDLLWLEMIYRDKAGKLGFYILDDWTSEDAKKRSAIPSHIRETVWQRDGECCRYCGDIDGPFHLDHVNPWSRGGKHTTDNLVVSCASCNLAKSDRTPEEMGWSLSAEGAD